jgi:hypothetical protein
MSTLQSYLNRGFRVVGGRYKGSGGTSKVKCPVESCGLIFGVESATKPSAKAVEVDQMADLSMAIANRRYRLGLASDDVDYAAGLGQRHVQKVEDAGRNIGEGKTISADVMLCQLARVLEDGLTPALTLALERMIATRVGLDGKKPQRPRVPNIDTVLLVVQALGGKLMIDWGTPPRITQRLIDTSANCRKAKTEAANSY